jgi:hypothetical protein
LGVPFYRAKALLDLGRSLATRGDADRAREALDVAATLFTDLGATPWVDEVRAASLVSS